MAKIRSYDDIVGHRNIIRFLKSKVEKDSMLDVLLFWGNPGLGKTSLAKLVAIDVVTRYHPELKDKYIKEVIDEDKSTDSIKLFNMSKVGENDEEIQRVLSELNVGFSITGRKVLILDEAQNISKKAQDATLRDLENLPENVYVIICTTDVGKLNSAVISRCKTPLFFADLSQNEAKILLKREIEDKRLTFSMSMDMVIALISDYSENQPRIARNLLDNFEDGQVVTREDIELFINTNAAPSIIELMKYIYGSLTLGITYIDSLRLDKEFTVMLLEVCKVALGHSSNRINVEDIQYIREFIQDKDVMHLLQFTCEVCSLSSVVKRRVIAAFIRAHVTYVQDEKPSTDTKTFQTMDKLTLIKNIEEQSVINISQSDFKRPPSLEELMSSSPEIN